MIGRFPGLIAARPTGAAHHFGTSRGHSSMSIQTTRHSSHRSTSRAADPELSGMLLVLAPAVTAVLSALFM